MYLIVEQGGIKYAVAEFHRADDSEDVWADRNFRRVIIQIYLAAHIYVPAITPERILSYHITTKMMDKYTTWRKFVRYHRGFRLVRRHIVPGRAAASAADWLVVDDDISTNNKHRLRPEHVVVHLLFRMRQLLVPCYPGRDDEPRPNGDEEVVARLQRQYKKNRSVKRKRKYLAAVQD